MKNVMISPSVKLLWFFFAVLIIAFGKGFDHNPQLAEDERQHVESYVAPFLLISTGFLLLFTQKDLLFDFMHIPFSRLWLFFFAYLFILTFFREDFNDDFRNFSVILLSYLILFMLLRFVYWIPFEQLEDLFIKISFTICILCVIVHLGQGLNIVFFPDRSANNFDRLGGLFYYAHTAALCSITLLFSFKRYLDTKGLIFIVICGVCGLLLIATDTRSAWFATAFSLLFLRFKNVAFYKLFLASVFCYFISTTLVEIASPTSLGASSADSKFRLLIWQISWELASNRLFTGYGNVNPFAFYQTGIDKLTDPHNSFISLILQSGIVAFFIFLTIFVLNLIRSIKVLNSDYRFLYFYWLFFPFFWGNIYNNLASFISMYMMFTIYSFALNPNQHAKLHDLVKS